MLPVNLVTVEVNVKDKILTDKFQSLFFLFPCDFGLMSSVYHWSRRLGLNPKSSPTKDSKKKKKST